MDSPRDDSETISFLPKAQAQKSTSIGPRAWITCASLLTNVMLVLVGAAVLLNRNQPLPECSASSRLYCRSCTSLLLPLRYYHCLLPKAPAQEAIRYRSVVFQHSTVNTPTKYWGLGRNVDKAWQALYTGMSFTLSLQVSSSSIPEGESIITEDEAQRLANWTQAVTVGDQATYYAKVRSTLYVDYL